MTYLTLDDLLYVAERAIGTPPEIRDIGLLQSAAARPQASAFGADAYPGLHAKAAALVHSLAKNHALVDGNKRIALAGLIAFLGVNGVHLTWSNDEAFEFVMGIAAGEGGAADDISAIADRIADGSEPRG